MVKKVKLVSQGQLTFSMTISLTKIQGEKRILKKDAKFSLDMLKLTCLWEINKEV